MRKNKMANPKTLIIIMTLIMIIPITIGLEECKSITPPGDVPCKITTSWQPPNACNTYTAKIFNSSGIQITNHTLDNFGNTGLCNFTFMNNTPDTYTYNITTGDTGTVTVEDTSMSWQIAAIMSLLGIIAFFGYFARNIDNKQWYVKLFFFFLCFMFSLISVGYVTSLAEEAGANADTLRLLDTTYMVLLWATIIFFAYAVLVFGWKSVMTWMSNKKQREEGNLDDFLNK